MYVEYVIYILYISYVFFFHFDFLKLYFVMGAVCAEFTNTDLKAQSHYSVRHQRM